MKKIYSLFFTAFYLATQLSAQPTLTGANTNPTSGQSFTSNTVNYQPPGASGASVTWNFASLSSTGTSSYSWVNPTATPYNSYFTGATLATQSPSQYAYYSASSSAYSIVGAYSTAQNYAIPYSDPEKLLAFPFTYNSTFTDNLYASYTANSFPFIRSGTSSATADGYGTLILPYGTLNNVLRIHLSEDYRDTSANLFGIHYIGDYYLWYLPGTHAPVLEFATFTAGGQPTTFGYYLSQSSLGVEEDDLYLSDLSLFPNPSASVTDLFYSIKKSCSVHISLLDMQGKVISEEFNEEQSVGEHSHHFDLTELPSGIYLVKVDVGGRSITRKLIRQ